jgi:hypothetical protein
VYLRFEWRTVLSILWVSEHGGFGHRAAFPAFVSEHGDLDTRMLSPH